MLDTCRKPREASETLASPCAAESDGLGADFSRKQSPRCWYNVALALESETAIGLGEPFVINILGFSPTRFPAPTMAA